MSTTAQSGTRTTSPPNRQSQPGDMYACFGPGGWLQNSHPAYEYRPGQLQMAKAVDAAFKQRRHLLVEAGTGTGKTLAYLIPALLSEHRVIISTGTKNLQDQLYYKDVPFLAEHLAPILGRPLRVCYMKGRSNYLCRQKVYDMDGRPMLRGLEEVEEFARIREWEETSETGDRSELAELAEDSSLWHRLDARREACTGSKCKQYDRCFLTLMHTRALDSDIIIVNHHLFFADLALRQNEYGGILPNYAAVVFDEAHEIEQIAGEYFGLECSNFRFDELVRDAEQTLRQKECINSGLTRALKRLHEDSQMFYSLFPAPEGRFGFDQRERFLEKNFDHYSAVQNAVMRLRSELGALTEKPEEVHTLMGRIDELRGDLTFLMESKDRRFVHWYERRGRGLYLQATPIDVAPILTERLFDAVETIVLTSATLAVGGNFDFVKSRLGIRRAEEIILDPHFDYPNQALLYLPPEMPEPNDPAFSEAAVEEIIRLIEISRGRAFVLFTSNQQMRLAHDRVKQLLGRGHGKIRYPLLLQGTAPKRVLLEQFQSEEMAGAVLFATSSFWQGVDVPGEKLSAVIIDRLPFAVPSDPVVKARVDSLREGGGNPFYEYQVPDAVIALKQGFGRLIRNKSDRGVLALLDPRIRSKNYGRVFIESLPSYRVTRDRGDVAQMFEEIDRK